MSGYLDHSVALGVQRPWGWETAHGSKECSLSLGSGVRRGRWVPNLSEFWFLCLNRVDFLGLPGGLNRFSVTGFHPYSGC